ncbi:MAG TPA: GyrI-like domain-containing protein [Methanomassiliicoccales archaeon]|nr:GyrI-like domain-containing protein [Methanomassiliicoccales archaeon]
MYFPPTSKVVEVVVPQLRFLTIEGQGDPNSSKEFQRAIEALYSISYTLKFTIKKQDASKDFRVGPLEGLWWNTEEGELVQGKKSDWAWKAMILLPSSIEEGSVEGAREAAMGKKDNPSLNKVVLEDLEEGRSAQITHVGPWSAEAESINRVKDFIKEKGGVPRGKHHEIYMSDPRRVAPEKLKTVIRQPFGNSINIAPRRTFVGSKG